MYMTVSLIFSKLLSGNLNNNERFKFNTRCGMLLLYV